MKTPNQRGKHVALGGVIVVAGAVEVGGHQADRIEAVLLAQRLTQFDAADLGDGVPLVGGLQGTTKQRLLADRLGGELGVDATAPQKEKPAHPTPPCRFDHMGLDLEILQQEISWIGVVGLNAPHLRGRQHHHSGVVLVKPAIHRHRIQEIELLAAGGEQGSSPSRVAVTRPLQSTGNRTARHAAMAGHKNPIAFNHQGTTARARSHQACAPWRAAATAPGLVGGFSIDPTTAKPWRLSKASFAASS